MMGGRYRWESDGGDAWVGYWSRRPKTYYIVDSLDEAARLDLPDRRTAAELTKALNLGDVTWAEAEAEANTLMARS